MRAARLTGPRQVEIVDAPLPEPASHQVRVRLEGCGVCGSNLPVWQGRPWFQYPLDAGAPGHEGWGIVESVGSDVGRIAPGDRVALLSYKAFAEYDVADAEAVIRLPDELQNIPLPGEPLGCAYNVFRRSQIGSDDTVAIIGIGFLGALLTQLAARAGARVFAISRRPTSLDVASRCGAAEVIPMVDHAAIVRQVMALTGGAGCSRVIEAVGEQWPLDLAGELTRERGMLIIAGYHQESPRQVNMQLWNWRGLDVINAHERAARVYVQGMSLAIEAIAAGVLDPAPLMTHRVELEDLAEGLSLLEERPAGFLKGWVSL
jgi:threonine dehydrogenase-like Zn-dependent dehydrogenase